MRLRQHDHIGDATGYYPEAAIVYGYDTEHGTVAFKIKTMDEPSRKIKSTFSPMQIAQMHTAYLIDTQNEDTTGLHTTIAEATTSTAGVSSVQSIMGAKADPVVINAIAKLESGVGSIGRTDLGLVSTGNATTIIRFFTATPEAKIQAW